MVFEKNRLSTLKEEFADLADAEQLTSNAPMRVGIMVDTESLGLHHGSIMREIALVGFDLDDPNTILGSMTESLPLLPQEKLGRTMSIETVGWLLGQPSDVAERIRHNIEGDYDELTAMCRSFNRKYIQLTELASEVEVWLARPQHDIPMIQSLFEMVGLEIPWKYNYVNDLRTLMNEANMNPRDEEVKKLAGKHQLHTAIGDCHYQIRCYGEAIRKIRTR